MPIRSGAMQRPNGSRYGSTLRQRYDEVGLPCSSTMGSPLPTSTYDICLPRIPRRCFLYGNTAEIILASPTLSVLDAGKRDGVKDFSRDLPGFCRAWLLFLSGSGFFSSFLTMT